MTDRETAQQWAERMVREGGPIPDDLLRWVARVLRGDDYGPPNRETPHRLRWGVSPCPPLLSWDAHER